MMLKDGILPFITIYASLLCQESTIVVYNKNNSILVLNTWSFYVLLITYSACAISTFVTVTLM